MNTIHKSVTISKNARDVKLELIANKSVKGIVKNRSEMYCNFAVRMTSVRIGEFPSLDYLVGNGIVEIN
jgi:hypothetical protein